MYSVFKVLQGVQYFVYELHDTCGVEEQVYIDEITDESIIKTFMSSRTDIEIRVFLYKQ